MKPWEADDTFLSRWLNEELTPEELQAFEASSDYADYVRTARALDAFEVGDYDAQAALKQVKQRLQPTVVKPLRTSRSWYYAAAAVVLLLISFTAIWYLNQDSSIEILAQENQEISLPDGSIIQLEAGSLVRYSDEDWEENRSVFLQGQAYFEVEKGKKFDILLEQGQVQILGTSFNIIEKQDTLRVVCYTGKVSVDAFGEKTILNPGEAVTAIKNAAPITEATSLAQPLWLSNRIRLQDIPLGEVISQLTEIYGFGFIGNYDSDALFNGTFPTDDLEAALLQVFGPFSLTYQIDTSRNAIILE